MTAKDQKIICFSTVVQYVQQRLSKQIKEIAAHTQCFLDENLIEIEIFEDVKLEILWYLNESIKRAVEKKLHTLLEEREEKRCKDGK